MKSVMKTTGAAFFYFILFLCAQERAIAAPTAVRLSGAVSDSTTGNPVAGAVVAFPQIERSAVSDESGAFVADSLPSTPGFMIVTAKGYAVRRISLTAEDAVSPVKVSLVKSPANAGADTTPVPQTPAAAGADTTAASHGASETVSPTAHPAYQSRTAAGKVIDKKSGRPIPDAIVSVASRNTAVPCDSHGTFTIDIPTAVACTLVAAKNGYGQASVPVDTGAENVMVEFALSQSSVYELQDMDVSAGRIEVKQMVKTSEKISQVKMAPELVSKLPGVGQADLFRSLQLLPGVSGTNEASSGLYVRGGTPDQNLIILDQMPIYYVDHFYGFFSAFNPRAIGDVTLHKGGFGAQWGGRLSSVVEMSSSGMDATYDSSEMGIRAGVGTGLLSSDASLQVPLFNKNVGTLMISGRRAMTDMFKTDLFSRIFGRMHGTDTLTSQSGSGKSDPMGVGPQERIAFQPKFFFWDVNGLASFNLGSRGKLATTFFRSQDDQDNSLDTAWAISSSRPVINWTYIKDTTKNPAEKPPMTMDTLRFDTTTSTTVIKNKAPVSWGNICIGQQWEQEWSDAFTTRLNLSYSQFLDKKTEDVFRMDSTSIRHSDTTSPWDTTRGKVSWMSSTNKITDFSGRFDNSIKFSDRNTLNAGVEISRKTVVYERDTIQPDTTTQEWLWGYRPPQSPPVRSYDTGASMAVYAEDEMKFGDRAGLTPGLRLYYFQLASAGALDPRMSGWCKPFPNVKLKAAWGMYTQEIHRVEEEDITGGGKFVWLLTRPGRPFEKSQHLIGGASWEKTHFLLDLEGYIKRMSGLLTISERNRSSGTYWGQPPFDPNQLALFEGTGFARGVELLAQVKNVRFPLFSKNTTCDGWAAYTWSRVENTYAVFNGGNPFPATHDHTHEVKLVGTVEWDVARWSSVDLGAVWIYSTGAPYTAPLGKYTLTLLDSTTQRSYMYVSAKNAYRLPDYHRLDLSVAWKVRFGGHVQGRLTMGLFNAYNHENILERAYTETQAGGFNGRIKIPYVPGSEMAVFTAMDRQAMSIMPNAALEVTAKF